MGGISLHCLDQVWNQVVPTLQLHIDIRIGGPHLLPQRHEAVVEQRHPNQQDGNDDRQRNPSHIELPPLPGSSATTAAPTAGKAASAPTTATASCRRLRDCG